MEGAAARQEEINEREDKTLVRQIEETNKQRKKKKNKEKSIFFFITAQVSSIINSS